MASFSFASVARATTTEFAGGGITLNDDANANPYPSTVTVSGVVGPVTAVRVKINGLSHTNPDDIDALLVAPNGAVSAVFSDAGGAGNPVANVNLILDDDSATALPDDTQIFSGTHSPVDFEPGEALPPGGSGNIGTNLTALATGGVNGDWKLFVRDDQATGSGAITSWALEIDSGLGEIAVSGNGTDIANGDNSPDTSDHTNFGGIATGSGSLTNTFTITNSGPDTLRFPGSPRVAVSGANPEDFMVSLQPDSPVAPSGLTTFEITFDPSADGTRTAMVSIANNDPDENPFEFAITGYGLGTSLDVDGDGMNDLGEYRLASLGFDWETGGPVQEDMVDTYFSSANTNNLFRASQIKDLNLNTPILVRDAGGMFKLTLGLEKSTDLLTFEPFPMVAPGTTEINPEGNLDFQFSMPDDTAFFRVLGRANNNRWASSVLGYSSQFTDLSWSAARALGEPDVYPFYADDGNAWATQEPDAEGEFIELGFNESAPISSVSIYETYAPGAVSQISVRNPETELWEVVWTGVAAAAPAEARVFRVTFPMTSFPVDAIRIDLSSELVPDWNEIDAVSIGL